MPTVRPISWPATIPQLLALAAAVTIGWSVTHAPSGVFWGAAVYLAYSFGSRKFIPRAHRRGVRLSQAQQFEDAIRAHEESYAYFTRHSWLDRYRSITMMSPSAMSYREMALLNVAFAHSQLGNGEKAKEYYQRASREFPNSAIANAALKMIGAFERPPAEADNAK